MYLLHMLLPNKRRHRIEAGFIYHYQNYCVWQLSTKIYVATVWVG
jgi:hypothetical protein